jgi:virginiamycin B lyase
VRNRNVAVLLPVALSTLVFSISFWAAGNSGSISGVVKTPSGQPLAAAFVKVRHQDRPLVFMVISQQQGTFRAADLPPGKYRAQAIGGGFQSELSAAMEVNDGREATVNLNLTTPQPHLPKNMLGEVTLNPALETEYTKSLPAGDGKKLLVERCTICHTLLERVDTFRGDRNAWAAIVEIMRDYTKKDVLLKKDLMRSEEEAGVLVDYLVKNFGPDGPPKVQEVPESLQTAHLPRTLLVGPAAKYKVFEYDLPHGVLAHDVALDSKGIAWVDESRAGVIGRFDPASYTYTRIPLPEVKSGKFAATFSLYAIEVDAQDRVWAVDGRNNRVVQYDPKEQKFTTYMMPEAPQGGSGFNTIRIHTDGSVWGTQIGANRIARLDPATKQFRFYPIPSKFSKQGSGGYAYTGATDGRNRGGARPYGMAVDGKGKVWFVAPASGKLAELDPKSGEFAEHVPPGGVAATQRMNSDAEGNIWFVSKYDNRLGKVDIRTGKMTLYTPPTPDSGPYSVSVDKTHNLIWFSEHLANQIARFDPRTNTFTEYSVATPLRDMRRIEVDRSRPNRVWYSGYFSDEFGYIEVLEDK